MKIIIKQAADTVYKLLWLKQNAPEKYDATLELASRYTPSWG
jgi:sugar (pentulose or hexulose) kinase